MKEKQNEVPNPTQQIADNIIKLAEAVEKLLKGPLNRKALLVLLANSSGHSQNSVNQILTAIADLKKDWLK